MDDKFDFDICLVDCRPWIQVRLFIKETNSSNFHYMHDYIRMSRLDEYFYLDKSFWIICYVKKLSLLGEIVGVLSYFL